MGQLLAHVLKDKKTGRLSYRRLYPPELLPYLDVPEGKSTPPVELKRSLKAKSIADPGALQIYQEANAEWEANVAVARKRAHSAFDKLSAEAIGYLAKLYVREWHEGDEKALQSRGDDFAIPSRHYWEDKLSDYIRWQGEGDTDSIVEEWSDRAERFLKAQRFVRDPEDAIGFDRLCKALNAAAIDYSPTAQAQLGGAIIALPPPPPLPEALSDRTKKPTAANALSFEDIAESILENQLRKVGAATKQASRTALRFFREEFGNPVPSRITKAAVTDWLQLLALRPAKLPASQRDLALSEVVELYRDQDVPRLSQKTLMTHLGTLAALWTKATDDGLIPEELVNPFKSRKYLTAETPEEPQELSLDELHAIFALSIFTAGERPTRGKGQASYWIPLLLLWTGARPEEIAQLMVSDVFKDPDDPDGRWRLRITDEGVHPHKGARRLKTAKGKRAGRREFPVPAPLLNLNFIDYVEHLKASGEIALFPKLRTKGDRLLLFQGFSEWWNGLLQEKGILPAGQGRRAAREFRHNWTSAARASGIPEDAREYIQGHYRAGTTANEGYGSRKSLGRYIDALEYSGLDLSGVKPWKPR